MRLPAAFHTRVNLFASMLLGLCALGLPAQAAESAAAADGFAPEVRVADATLRLNGHGTRYKVVFKVYDLGFYTTKSVGTAELALALDGPKKLHFKALRELSGTDLGALMLRGIQDNNPPDTFNKYLPTTHRLIEIFSARRQIKPGDTFGMDYVPGKGTYFYFKGERQGDALGDADFFAMVLRIWLGPRPVDEQLKQAMLGVKPTQGGTTQ